MQEAVHRLVQLGEFPDEHTAEAHEILRYQKVVESLEKPASNDEALAVLNCFPRGNQWCFGLARALLHSVESAPGWPLSEGLDGRSWWVRFLKERADRATSEP